MQGSGSKLLTSIDKMTTERILDIALLISPLINIANFDRAWLSHQIPFNVRYKVEHYCNMLLINARIRKVCHYDNDEMLTKIISDHVELKKMLTKDKRFLSS